MGKNFWMGPGCIIDDSLCWLIRIGDDVTLAPNVHILAHDASTRRFLNYARIGKVTIGDRVFLGAGAIVLPGVRVGNNVIIGAGSVVSHDIPDGKLAAGVPARVVCTVEEFLARKRLEMEVCPCFGEEYTIRKEITAEKKAEMLRKIDRFGYLV